MLSWILENGSTILVLLLLLTAVVLVIVKLLRDRKAGRSTCGCGCSGCPMSGSCQRKD